MGDFITDKEFKMSQKLIMMKSCTYDIDDATSELMIANGYAESPEVKGEQENNTPKNAEPKNKKNISDKKIKNKAIQEVEANKEA